MKKNRYSSAILCSVVLMTLGLANCDKKSTGPQSGSSSVQTAAFEKVGLPDGITETAADLVIKGKIAKANPVLLDLATIMQFPKISFTTFDPWDEKDQKYTGVSLISLLEYLQMDESADHIEVIAMNDYQVPIRVEDLRKYEYVLAYEIDGVLLKDSASMQKKGVLMIELNFDKHKDIDVEIYKSHLVWQAGTIIVK